MVEKRLPRSIGEPMIVTGKAVRTLALVFVVTAALVSGSRGGLLAEEPNKCGLEEMMKNELTNARVELLLAAGNTAPRERRESYEQNAHAVAVCVAGDSRLELLPITNAGVGITPVFARTVPKIDPNGVPLQEQKKRKEFLEAADTAIKEVLNTTKVFDHSDPIGTLYAAGEALHRSQAEGKRVVIVIGNGWQQTKNIDIFAYRKNPAAQADRVIDFLRQQSALPNLTGSDVIFTGFALGDAGIQMTPIEIIHLCDFWKKVVHASHGSTPLPCEQVLPGMTGHMEHARGGAGHERGLAETQAAVVGRYDTIHPERRAQTRMQ
jgi:hypothetical protein